ncbi:MAG: SagB/ThcOx family dehydrogenase [Holophagales bacterium]|jgi:SagB-type dehydrogenase family enzyme|nr:SagB/ThcOx family dehydrogenase [Holophagales bacterium]
MRTFALSLLATVLMAQETQAPKPIKLPAHKGGSLTLDKALEERQSTRNLTGPALSLDTLSQLLWSAQGENRPGKRTVPSANARYPLELYVVATKSDALADGVYKYSPKDHSMLKVKDGNPETIFGSIKGMQPWIPKCPAVFIFSGVSSRMGGNDPQRKEAYTFWESGAAVQALLLQVTANGLGATVVSGVDLDAVKSAAGLLDDEKISVIVPVGRIAK